MATTIEQVASKATDLGYDWAVSDLARERYDDARDYARAILAYVDARQAPGSETSLRTDANIESARCADADLIHTLDWFLRAYTVQDRLADADDETREAAYEYLFSGSLEAAEGMVATHA